MTLTCTAPIHDTYAAYKKSCRCPAACAAGSRAQKYHRTRVARGQKFHVDSIGARRRIQALAALGWRAQDVADRIGTTAQCVSQIGQRPSIYITTARRIAEVYDDLADQAGPSKRGAERAAKKGWLQPLWWDEDTIDDPTFDPLVEYADPVVSREANRASDAGIVAELTEKGMSARDIAERLGCSERRVVRLRGFLRDDGHMRQAS